MARPLSIVNRLTLWFTITLFSLVAVATGYLYWSNNRAMTAEEVSIARDRIQAIESLLGRADPIQSLKRRIDTEWASRHFERLYVQVLDGADRVLVESPGMPDEVLHTVFTSPAEGRVSTSEGSDYLLLVHHLPASADGSSGFTIRVALDLRNEQRIISRYRAELLAVLVLTLIVSILIGRGLAIQAFRPVRDMIRTIRRVSSSSLHERISDPDLPEELRNLAETANEMLGRLEEAFGRLSRFSSDLAHELRTPINNIRGEIEVGLTRSRSTDEYRQVLESSLEETDRLAKIIDTLLFIAKAENPATNLKREPVELEAEIAKVVEFYEAPAAEMGVAVHYSIENGLKVNVERTLFQRVIANLLSNSLNHTASGGKIEVKGVQSQGGAVISIRDTGEGISEEDLPKVFDRFYRVDQARSATKLGGFGLGLTLVKSIVQLHGGEITIESTRGHGTTVSVVIPQAGST